MSRSVVHHHADAVVGTSAVTRCENVWRTVAVKVGGHNVSRPRSVEHHRNVSGPGECASAGIAQLDDLTSVAIPGPGVAVENVKMRVAVDIRQRHRRKERDWPSLCR